jgi:uracil-DNA glycosylase family 4
MSVPLPLVLLQEQIVQCVRCPRLRAHCERVAREKKRAYRDQEYWGRPVPGFGDPDARVLLVGLAPAAHGANRTGRMFTGDSSGDFLMAALHRAGFANIPSSRHAADGLRLTNVFLAAAARCAPPDNKPLPSELAACFPWLREEAAALPRVRVVVALGRIAFAASLRLLRERGLSPSVRPAFAHGAVCEFVAADDRPQPQGLSPAPPVLIASYHPSQQNTNTGRLTPAMFDAVFREARRLVLRLT